MSQLKKIQGEKQRERESYKYLEIEGQTNGVRDRERELERYDTES